LSAPYSIGRTKTASGSLGHRNREAVEGRKALCDVLPVLAPMVGAEHADVRLAPEPVWVLGVDLELVKFVERRGVYVLRQLRLREQVRY
jgi:hypothetical protein